jgi:hypothetical protein
LLAAALLVPLLAAAGCGGVTSDPSLTLRITVRASGLSATDRARARFVVLTVSGPGVTPDGAAMVSQPAALAAGELSDGETEIFYRTTVKSGGLTFYVTLQDAAHQTIASGNASTDLQTPNVIVELTGPVDGGVPEAGTPDGGTPDASPDGGGPTCGNGVIDGDEMCDGNCPTACPTIACQQRTLMGAAATCDAHCVNAETIAMCANGDGCCPLSCNANNDNDCPAFCGNGIVETNELCDGTCATSCPALGCQQRTLSGAATMCNAQCTNGATTTACANNDGCCPPGCTAANDNNCSAACGDGVLQTPEVCDGNCPTACPALGCQLRTLSGTAATCDARCVQSGTITRCASNDGCCPAGCNAANDNDCTPTCGNGVLEGSEVCDGNCPTSCPANRCQTRTLSGSAATCNAKCVDGPVTATCANGDGCCPASGCNANNDNDCGATCGNGVIEGTEVCDGNCPTACPAQGCNLFTLSGTGCSARCAAAGTITACANGDGCCPSGCNANNDNNCSSSCGNRIVEAPEVCDGNCPTSCPAQGCQLRALSGSATTCNAQCVNGATITSCASNDGCCPTGCNANNDNNCTPSCGNGIVETGELCDGSCPTACPQMGCQLYSLTGTACTRACTAAGTQTQCLAAADGCCPAGCSAATDGDCTPTPPTNDKCDKATDITAGGRFPIDFEDALQDTKPTCGVDGADVFFTFTLTSDEWIYLDVLDQKAIDATIDATIELWADACPTQGRVVDCQTSAAGEKRCQRTGFPLLVVTPQEGAPQGKPLSKGRYFVVVRATGKPTTSWSLGYHHVPIGCATVQLTPDTTNQVVVDTTCQRSDLVTPPSTCIASQGLDVSYLVVKCPSTALGFSTCNGRSAAASSLSAVFGSETRDAASGQCKPSTGTVAACAAPGSATSCTAAKSAATISLTAVAPGLVTVTVDAATCGSYGLVYTQAATKSGAATK